MQSKNIIFVMFFAVGVFIIFNLISNQLTNQEILSEDISGEKGELVQINVIPADFGENEYGVENMLVEQTKKPDIVGKLDKFFAVQVGSFQDKNRAESVLKKLKKNDYQAYITNRNLEGKGVWYRVSIGKFKDRNEARKTLNRVRQDYWNSFIILQGEEG